MSPAPELPATPGAAAEVFGPRLDLAEHYLALLATTGVEHGLIGPREVPRLWDRHLLNCGVVSQLLPEGAAVADIGSGAGLPGLVLAVARPDLQMHLIEPLLRRTTWLESSVAELGLSNVRIHRGKADAFWGEIRVPFVTARAVSRLANLAAWSRPLLTEDGRLLALKGRTAEQEIADDRQELTRQGFGEVRVVEVGADLLDPPTTVVTAEAVPGWTSPQAGRRGKGKRAGSGGRRRRH